MIVEEPKSIEELIDEIIDKSEYIGHMQDHEPKYKIKIVEKEVQVLKKELIALYESKGE